MAEKYCLLLLLSSGYPSRALEENLLKNPQLKENFFYLRMTNPTHIFYEKLMNEPIEEEDLPMLIMGDQIVIQGDEAVMDLMNKQAMAPPEGKEAQNDFAQDMMAKILPAMRKFNPEDNVFLKDQEFYDKATNQFEKMFILILGAFFLNLPHFDEFLIVNDLEFPEYPFEIETPPSEKKVPLGVIDLEFDENFLSPFWQFSLSPPNINDSNKWLELFKDLNELGVPIKGLLKSMSWYLGQFSVKNAGLTILSQIKNIFPPSWGEILELELQDEFYLVGIQLNTKITNHYGWDLMFLAFFLKGAIDEIAGMEGKKINNVKVYYKAASQYFEFKGKIREN